MQVALSLLLLNIFMCSMLLVLNIIYLTDYADDNTLFMVGDNTEDMVHSLMRSGGGANSLTHLDYIKLK